MSDTKNILTQSDTALGNTSTRAVRGRVWCFTLNNTDDTINTHVRGVLENEAKKFIFQEEIGEQKTPHLQGFIQFTNARSFDSVKQLLGHNVHIEKCKDINASIQYCRKKETRVKGPWAKGINIPRDLIDPLEGKQLYNIQLHMSSLLNDNPDDRKVHWVYDPEGKAGKTSFAKSHCIRNPTTSLFVSGKAKDIKYAIIKFMEDPSNELKTVFIGLPRTIENYVSYDAIESIKDGIFFSSKYESGMCIFNSPHVMILSNFPPQKSKLSKDRWNIVDVREFNEKLETVGDIDNLTGGFDVL